MFKTFSFFSLCFLCSAMAVSLLFTAHTTYAGTDNTSANDVTGFAWSDNIGWISFSCTDLGTCGTSQYGVDMDDASGVLSGYAWSDNIGWISFNAADVSGCPSGSCTPTVNSDGTVSGWAKALSANSADGWDGWISLHGSGYGVQYNDSTGFFSNFAWGSDVVGWISFNHTDTNSSVNYAVVHSGNRPIVFMSCGADGTNATATIRWPGSSGAASYHIHRSTTPSGQYTDLSAGTKTTYVDKNLPFNATYYYTIVAADASGNVISTTDATSQSTAGVCDGFPSVPSNVSASPACSATGDTAAADLSWSASTGETSISYDIYRSTTESGTYTLVGNSSGTTYTDDNLSLGNTYYYKVAAENDIGTSAQSSDVSVTTSGSCVTPPSAISGYSICGTATSTDATVHLSWNDSQGQAPIAYHILKSNGSGFSEIGQSNTATYDDAGNTLGSTAVYEIKAIDGGGNSAVTPSISVVVQSSCNQSNPSDGNLGINYFRAVPSIGNPGYMCTLSWQLSGYNQNTTCEITGKHSVRPFNPNQIGASGTQQVYNIIVTSPFLLTCTQGDSGAQVKKTATCSINPKIVEIN